MLIETEKIFDGAEYALELWKKHANKENIFFI